MKFNFFKKDKIKEQDKVKEIDKTKEIKLELSSPLLTTCMYQRFFKEFSEDKLDEYYKFICEIISEADELVFTYDPKLDIEKE